MRRTDLWHWGRERSNDDGTWLGEVDNVLRQASMCKRRHIDVSGRRWAFSPARKPQAVSSTAKGRHWCETSTTTWLGFSTTVLQCSDALGFGKASAQGSGFLRCAAKSGSDSRLGRTPAWGWGWRVGPTWQRLWQRNAERASLGLLLGCGHMCCWAVLLNWARKGKNRGREEEKSFYFLKGDQTNEVKHKFEFNQPKTMHRHVCNK
jgi:hypothetical protein